METSQHYPQLSRYCYAWDWLVQFRVYKPNKQKKEWIEWADAIGPDVESAEKSIQFLCERKGWTLQEIFFLKPTVLAFAFDRDAPEHEFLTTEQKQLIPRPAPRGSEYKPLTQAQRQEQQRQAKLARLAEREAQQRQRQEQRQRHRLTTAYPLLAAELLANDFPQAA